MQSLRRPRGSLRSAQSSLAWALASVATVIALASAWHSGGHMWRRLNQDHKTYAAYSQSQRAHAPIDAVPLPNNIFDWYAKYVGPGDRIYFQVLPSGLGSLTLPEIVSEVGRFYLLPAVEVADLKQATVVVSYETDPVLLRLPYLTKQQLDLQPFYVARLRAP